MRKEKVKKQTIKNAICVGKKDVPEFVVIAKRLAKLTGAKIELIDA